MPHRPSQAYLDSIAANVRRIRTRLGLTQEQLAEKAGLQERFVQRVERAKLDMRLSSFFKLVEALEVPPSAVLRRSKLVPARPGRPPGRRIQRSRRSP